MAISLLLDLDSQPTLSSYYSVSQKAQAGAYELIALNLTIPERIISRTAVVGLDLIFSNDDQRARRARSIAPTDLVSAGPGRRT
jgi:cellulose biosynthesis protein BcsQ